MPKRFIPLAVLFAALLVLLAHIGGRYAAAKPTFAYAETEKEIYLTFDDGPSTVVTGRVLDILNEEAVKATFFVVGERAAVRTQLLKRIAEEGHTLGVHSQTHIYADIYASDEALLADAAACAEVIKKATGVTPTVYRFPGGGGKDRERQTALLEGQGYRVVSWNAVCGDAESVHADADKLFETAVETAGNRRRVVLLLHDGAGHLSTAEALPRIIAHFREAGYTFCAF